MAPETRWLRRIPDALKALEEYPRPVILRRDLERLLGISRPHAANLMVAWGAVLVGQQRQLEKAKLVERFRRLAQGKKYRGEVARQEHLVETLRQAHAQRLTARVERAREPARVAGLPEGVAVESDRIEVAFDGPEDALRKLYALAQALLQDASGFRAVVGRRAVGKPAGENAMEERRGRGDGSA